MLDKLKILEVIDCTGFSCPTPLVKTQKYYNNAQKNTSFKVILDNEISALNIERFLKQNDCDYEIIKESETCYLIYSDVAKKQNLGSEQQDEKTKEITRLYYFASDIIGDGDREFGKIMLEGFIGNIKNLEDIPNTIIFSNGGVKALAESPNMQKSIQELTDLGVKTYICGACIEHFGVKDKLNVGIISNMQEVMTLLNNHDRIIRP